MGLTTANARQYVEFLDAVHVAIDPQLGAFVPDLKLHVGRPACVLKSSRKARIALLLGTGKVATIEVDETYAEAWVARAPTLGNRSAGCIDLNIFLEQNARPVRILVPESPAPEAAEAEAGEPEGETAPDGSGEAPFTVTKAAKRKEARVRALREQSEMAAHKLTAATTIQRIFGVALRARAPSPPRRLTLVLRRTRRRRSASSSTDSSSSRSSRVCKPTASSTCQR